MVLNDQCSNWPSVLAGALQGSIIGLLLFLVNINYLPGALESLVKHFAGDTSLFSTVSDTNMLADQLDKDLKNFRLAIQKENDL